MLYACGATLKLTPQRRDSSITLVTPLCQTSFLKMGPYRKLCALALRRVCPDQTLCKIAQCEPQCQRNGGAFARFLQDLAHIHAHSSKGRQSGLRQCETCSEVL